MRHIIHFAAALLVAHFTATTLDAETFFRRGDANADGRLDVSDPTFTLVWLFASGDDPSCEKALDADDSGGVAISDAVYSLDFLFRGGSAIDGLDACAIDTTADDLTCDSFPPCEYETVVSRYGTLHTIAGRGLVGGNGFNAWDEEAEGGPAIDAELSRPHFAMRDDAGRLFIADKDAHAIRRVDPDGLLHTVAGVNAPGNGDDEPGPGTERALFGPNGLWVRSDGTVYILDTGNAKVRRLGVDGALSTLFADPQPIIVGRGIWVRDDETLAFYCSGTEIRTWTPDDGVSTFSTGYAELGMIVVDPWGSLVATDRDGHAVYRLDEDGERTRIAGNGSIFGGFDGGPALEMGIEEVRAVWFLDTGGYLLGTHESSKVWYVDTRGLIHLFLNGAEDAHGGDGEHFQTPGFKVSEVRSITVDNAGNIIITENDVGFIRQIDRVPKS